MHTATFKLIGITPYTQSRALQSKKPSDETDADFEERVWRERCHTDSDGLMFIPAAAIKDGLVSASKYLGLKIPGKGNKTWTAKFKSGVMVVDNPPLGVKPDTLEGERLFVNSDGVKGSGKRVFRTYPTLPKWEAHVKVYILDDIITEPVFTQHLDTFVSMIGCGMHRPENGGFKGRSQVTNFRWGDE